eukprot:gnl/Dysnectes_brevis/277_a308_3526.p1 GENE.gnl/Dysnectes_brevis/277_a308_3526~~gnl/Dysnectes_brevis/277_a308_3526.p1  ORF type:complete len:451 (+),score=191.32 gnl/Dysnectes_brevis/277_a308_3526:52-1404(+)
MTKIDEQITKLEQAVKEEQDVTSILETLFSDDYTPLEMLQITQNLPKIAEICSEDVEPVFDRLLTLLDSDNSSIKHMAYNIAPAFAKDTESAHTLLDIFSKPIEIPNLRRAAQAALRSIGAKFPCELLRAQVEQPVAFAQSLRGLLRGSEAEGELKEYLCTTAVDPATPLPTAQEASKVLKKGLELAAPISEEVLAEEFGLPALEYSPEAERQVQLQAHRMAGQQTAAWICSAVALLVAAPEDKRIESARVAASLSTRADPSAVPRCLPTLFEMLLNTPSGEWDLLEALHALVSRLALAAPSTASEVMGLPSQLPIDDELRRPKLQLLLSHATALADDADAKAKEEECDPELKKRLNRLVRHLKFYSRRTATVSYQLGFLAFDPPQLRPKPKASTSSKSPKRRAKGDGRKAQGKKEEPKPKQKKKNATLDEVASSSRRRRGRRSSRGKKE